MNFKSSNVVVLVPAFNPKISDLNETIDSLLGQSYKVDICILDDGSTVPISPNESWPEYVRIIRISPNGGITNALRVGVDDAVSRGYDFIARLDVGDVSVRNRVECQMDYMVNNPNVDLLGARSTVINMDGDVIGVHGISGDRAVVSRYLKKNAAFKHSTFFIRAKSIIKFGNYNKDYSLAQDYELANRFSKMGQVACLNDVLVVYIDDPAGLSAKKRSTQIKNRLRIQLTYKYYTSLYWYMGISRTLVTMVIPAGIMKKISTMIWR